MSRVPETPCPESSHASLPPSTFERALIRYVVRRKGVLSLLLPLVLGGVAWGLKQVAEESARSIVQREQDKMEKVRDEARAEVTRMQKEHDALKAQKSSLEEGWQAQQKNWLALKQQVESLLKQSEKLPENLKVIQELRAELGTVKNMAGLQGDANKIIESLKSDRGFQETLTGSVSAEIAKVAEKTSRLEAEARDMEARMKEHAEQLSRLSVHPLIGGVPYRVAHFDNDPSQNFVSVHQASSLPRPVGKVFFDPQSEQAQFFRLSTSTSHESDKDGKAEVPRCHVLFKGWLPARSLKMEKTSFQTGQTTMIELQDDLAAEDKLLRVAPGYKSRALALFERYRMPFFTTGNTQPDWVEVTFEGWMAVTNGKLSKEPGYKSYLEPAQP